MVSEKEEKYDYTTLTVLLGLEMARKYGDDPAKAVVAQARVLMPRLAEEMAYTTVVPIIGARDPLAALDARIDTWFKLYDSRKNFVEAGCHGMLIYEKVVYPIKLDIEDEDDLQWAVEHEFDLYGKTGEVFVNQNKLSGLECHLMFFPEWGFTGDLKALVCHRSSSRGQSSLLKLFATGAANKGTRKR